MQNDIIQLVLYSYFVDRYHADIVVIGKMYVCKYVPADETVMSVLKSAFLYSSSEFSSDPPRIPKLVDFRVDIICDDFGREVCRPSCLFFFFVVLFTIVLVCNNGLR